MDDIACKAFDEHHRKKGLAAVIKESKTALEVMMSDRAIYEGDKITFKHEFAGVLRDERCVKLLAALPPSLLWPGSGLLRTLKKIQVHHSLTATYNWNELKPASEALYVEMEVSGRDKVSIAINRAVVKEWSDPLTRPHTPTDDQVEAEWYKKHGFRGYYHYEKTGASKDYNSDGTVQRQPAVSLLRFETVNSLIELIVSVL